VSDKTVESHLSQVFNKLGISNRAAVGSKLRQLTVPDPNT
jgi:DNA-binding NarL/FixJ family response regulator